MWSDCVNLSIKLTYKKGWSIPLTLQLFSLYTDTQCHVWQKQVSIVIWISIIVWITVAIRFLDTHRVYVTVRMKFCVDVSVRLNMELLAVIGWQQAACRRCMLRGVSGTRRQWSTKRSSAWTPLVCVAPVWMAEPSDGCTVTNTALVSYSCRELSMFCKRIPVKFWRLGQNVLLLLAGIYKFHSMQRLKNIPTVKEFLYRKIQQ